VTCQNYTTDDIREFQSRLSRSNEAPLTEIHFVLDLTEIEKRLFDALNEKFFLHSTSNHFAASPSSVAASRGIVTDGP